MSPDKQFLTDHISKRINLSADERLEFADAFQSAFIKKKQMIVQPEFTARNRYFVYEGALRAYLICKEGHDHTIQFALEDWWITDYNSYIFQQPATMFVEALEDSKILKIDYDTEQRLKASNHKFETFFRMIAESSFAFSQRRIVSNLTQSAEVRYDQFTTKYPRIAMRVPQYTLASYLGVTTEYVSRLRNKRAKKKS